MTKKLVLELEFQFYGEDEREQNEVFAKVEEALIAVANLPALAVGTFVMTRIEDKDAETE